MFRPRRSVLFSSRAMHRASGNSISRAPRENTNEFQKAFQNELEPSASAKFARPTQVSGGPTPFQSKNEYHQEAMMRQMLKVVNSTTSGVRNSHPQSTARRRSRRREGVRGIDAAVIGGSCSLA